MVEPSNPAKKPILNKSAVYCRIRPQVFDGSGHDQTGEAVAKSLSGWTDTSVTLDTQYMFSKGENTYKFPTKVFTPESSQSDVYTQFDPLVSEFTSTPGRNVMLLAYGQTGTGKTHTIFGAAEAAVTEEQEAEWGLFPKVVNNTLKAMASKGAKFKLCISALEFYCGMCCDLLDKKTVIKVDRENGPRMSTNVELKSIEDLKDVLKTIFELRTATGTKMNIAKTGHSGSSRSHAALILTLY